MEGGREAARQLLTLSRQSLNLTRSTKILIHVFANVTSLATSLCQSGILSKADTFHEFVNGFNSIGELVTFVDVGPGKELTDSKINGTFSLKLS